MKKIIVLILTLIVALIIAVVVLFNAIKKEENNTIIDMNSIEAPSNITESQSTEYVENLRIAPRNITIAMNQYEGPVTQGMLEKDLYKLIIKHIPHLYDETKNFSEEQIGEYFDNNKQEINNMNIYSRDEFILICKDIQISLTEQTKLDMPSPIIELTTCENTAENYSFELLLKYTDARIIRLKTILSKTEERIEYQKYDELKDVFLKYNGPVTKQEIVHQVSTIVVNAKKIYDSSKDVSLNKIMQHYDLNRSEFEKLCIYSEKDYADLTNQIVRITWSKNPDFVGFKVDTDTIKSNETYTSFRANINYSTDQSINVNISIINSSDLVNENNPKIKITADVN